MSSLNRVTLSTVLGILLMGQAAWATTYYVDRLLPGNDSNSGTTEASPFLTVTKCVQRATTPGDTCLIKNGTYTSEGLITITTGGTAGNPITIKNYPGHTPHILWNDPTHLIINEILIAPGTAVCNTSPPGYIVIEGLEVSGGYSAIKIDCGHDIIIRNNHLHHNWYDAILIPAGFNITIDRNEVHHSGDFTGAIGAGGSPHSHNIYVVGKNYTITNNLIYDAYLYNLHLAAKPLGISPSPNTNYAGFSGLVANNTLAYSVTRGGIGLWDSGGGMSNTSIQNNIFYENSQNFVDSSQGIEYVSCGGCVVTVRNNLWYGTGNSVVFTRGACSSCTPSGTINANPLMVNAPSTLPASPDFALTSTSGAIDSGLDLRSIGVTSDLKGLPRPQGTTFDVGAYEISSDTVSPNPPQGLQVR